MKIEIKKKSVIKKYNLPKEVVYCTRCVYSNQRPSSTIEYKMNLNRNTRFVGVVVAYRDIEKARWRAVIEVDPTGYDDIDVNVESLAVYMKD